jgi:ribonuclease VapC
MMAVDTSALMAVVLREEKRDDCATLLVNETDLLISAATLAEALIVSQARNLFNEMMKLLNGLGFEILPVTADTAQRVAAIHRKWGRGRHEASLNFGDCFSYDTAKVHNCPLLFVGNDFTKTDIRPALVI